MNNHVRNAVRGRALVGAAAILVALSGCADLSGLGGTSHFACKAPPGVQCNSVSGNYENALQDNLPFQQAARAKGASQQTLPPPMPRAVFNPMRPAPAAEGLAADPLRGGPRIIRMWVNAWEDQDRDMVDQSYVYIQLDAGRWLVEHAQALTRAAYAPLRAATGAEPAQGTPAPRPAAPQELPVPQGEAAPGQTN